MTTGPQGASGATGPQGVTPPEWESGASGVSGASGPQGETYIVVSPPFLEHKIPIETTILNAEEPKGCLVAFWRWWFRLWAK